VPEPVSDPITTEDLIRAEEGFVPHAYPDSLGYLTIGYGTLIDKRKGGGITESEAFTLLRNRLAAIHAGLDEALPWWRGMNDTRRAVLASMAYQLGLAGVLRFARTLDAMEAGDYATAARGMRASLWAKQTPGRAARAARAMETGAFEVPT
jgi:lysozyme